MQQPNSDGDGTLPWAFVFDRAANVRALGNVQRRGLQAASQAVDRLLSSMNQASADPRPRTDEHDEPDSDISRLAEFWTELATRGLAEMSRMGRPDPNGSEPFPADLEQRVWIDLESGRSTGSLEMVANVSGSIKKGGEVWFHNRTGKPVGPIRLHSSELSSPDQTSIPASAIRFDPPVVKKLPNRSSRGVDVALSGDSQASPGIYRGIIQATGVPDLVVGIQLTVEDA
jgi:hypothetical protein